MQPRDLYSDNFGCQTYMRYELVFDVVPYIESTKSDCMCIEALVADGRSRIGFHETVVGIPIIEIDYVSQSLKPALSLHHAGQRPERELPLPAPREIENKNTCKWCEVQLLVLRGKGYSDKSWQGTDARCSE